MKYGTWNGEKYEYTAKEVFFMMVKEIAGVQKTKKKLNREVPKMDEVELALKEISPSLMADDLDEVRKGLNALVKMGLVKKVLEKEDGTYAGYHASDRKGKTIFVKHETPVKRTWTTNYYSLTKAGIDYVNSLRKIV